MNARAEGAPNIARADANVAFARAYPPLGICNAGRRPEIGEVLRKFMRAGTPRISARGGRRGQSPGARAAFFGLGLFVGASLLLYRHNANEGAVSPAAIESAESDLGNFYALIAEESRVRELFDERLKEIRHTGGYEGEGTSMRVDRFAPALDSPCGTEGFRRGSFYCMTDGKIYVDLLEMGEAKPSPHYRLAKLAAYHALDQTGRLSSLLRRHRRAPDRAEPLLLTQYEAECAAGAFSRSLIERAMITRRGLLDSIEREGESSPAFLPAFLPALLPALPALPEPLASGERRVLFEKGLDSARIETCERFAREALASKIRG